MVHLHVHSMYSLRDSIIKPDDLIARLKEIGQTAVAITDHGSSLGGVSFYKILKENGIKYIHGCEMYVCDNLEVKDKTQKPYHLIVLCKNDVGRKNLNRLISLSNRRENMYGKPRIDFQMLKEYSEGLLVSSACIAGEVSRYLMQDDFVGAETVVSRYKDLFGEDYYLEIQSHNTAEQISLNRKLVQLAQKMDVPLIVTSDAHHVWEQDRDYQVKYAFDGAYKEDGEGYVDCFVQSEDEVRERLCYLEPDCVEQMIANTHIVADKCNVEMPLSAPIMPTVTIPPEYDNSYEWLQSLCKDGFRTKLNINYDTKTLADPSKFEVRKLYDENWEEIGEERYQLSREEIQTYIDRYEYEMDSLHRMGFVDYILLVYSYANVAARRGIARGSGGGSLVCYLSNITDIDPIEHGLYFERFIDVGALSLLEKGEISAKELKIPDIDLDFSGDSCKTVLKYLHDTYGETHVASIGKFGSNYTKGTVRDMCRVLGIELAQADSIAKSFGDYQIEEIDSMITGDIPTPDNAKDAVRYVKQYSELFRYVRKLNGLPKSFGLHACGKIISVGELDDYLPSRYDANGIRFLEGDMHDVEDVGLVKVDVLGLRTLDQEFDTLEMSGEDRSFIRSKQSFNDKKVLDVFRNGDTVGIFQFSSPGMKKTLQKMDVRGIDDISIANALFRPGAMAYIDNFCKRRKGQEQFEYLHPDLEPILKNTYGIIVFQEQLIEIGRMAKIHNPDLLRKATGKKNPKLLNQVRPELEEKLKQRGWTDAQFEKLWTDMIEFSRYSFNKSHSSAYGILAYMTAKQKAYYPAEFFAGLCNSFLGDSAFVKDHAKEIMSDVYRHKVRVWPLDYRQDHRRCSVKDGGILFGIPLIKGMNAAVADTLWAMKDRKYAHFWQIVMEMQANGVTTAQIPNLIRLGFFSSWGSAKALLRVFDFCQQFAKGGEFSKTISKKKIENDQVLYSILEKHSESTNAKGVPLASFRKIDTPSVLSDVEEYCINNVRGDFSLKEKVATQVDLLGFVMGSGVQSDRPKLLVHEMYPVNRKSDNKQFAWSIVAQSIGSGKLERYTIRMALFKTNPIQVGQIIHCLKYEMYKQYYTITSYRILC